MADWDGVDRRLPANKEQREREGNFNAMLDRREKRLNDKKAADADQERENERAAAELKKKSLVVW
jgi:hypothetical protein